MLPEFDIFQDTLAEQFNKLLELEYKEYVGDTLDEVLENASIDLGIPISLLRFEVIQKGQRGIRGFLQKRWAISVIKEKNVMQQIDDFAASRNSFDLDLPPYSLLVKQTGDVFLRIFNIDPSEKETMVREISLALSTRGVEDLRVKEIYKSVFDSAVNEVYVGHVDYDEGQDARIDKFVVSEDNLEVSIIVKSPGQKGRDLTRKQIYDCLEKNDVRVGILDVQLERFDLSPQYEEPFLLARGIEPVHEGSEVIKYFFKTGRHDLVEFSEEIDPKSSTLIQSVTKDSVLAQITNFNVGKNGLDVFGSVIPYIVVEDQIKLEAGANTYLSAKEDILYAKIAGRVFIDEKNQVCIEEFVLVKGDVGPETGNIETDVSILIEGNVLSGYKVISRMGEIVIKGSVGKSYVSSSQNLKILGGVNAGISYVSKSRENREHGYSYGEIKNFVTHSFLPSTVLNYYESRGHLTRDEMEDGDEDEDEDDIPKDFYPEIYCGKDLYILYVSNAKIHTVGSMLCERGITNSEVEVGDTLFCLRSKAPAFGCHLILKNAFDIPYLGNEMEVETKVTLGYDPQLFQNLAVIKNVLLDRLIPDLEAKEKDMSYLSNEVHTLSSRLSRSKIEKLETLTEEVKSLKILVEELKATENQLKKEFHKKSTVNCFGFTEELYGYSNISINSANFVTKNEYKGKYIKIFSEDNEIRFDLNASKPKDWEDKKLKLLAFFK